MAITNGQTADADEVLDEIVDKNAAGILFNCITNDIAGLYEGSGELAETDYEEQGFVWSTGGSDKDDTGNSTAYLNTYLNAYTVRGTLLDEFDTGTVDTNIWTIGDAPVSETGGYMLVGGSGLNGDVSIVYADQVNAIDYKTLAKDVEIIFLTTDNGGGGAGATNEHSIASDGAASVVNLYSGLGGPSGATGLCRIQIDYSEQKARHIINEGTPTAWIDISSLAQWRLYFKHNNSGAVSGTPGMRVQWVYHNLGNDVSKFYQSTDWTIGTTVTGATLHIPVSQAVVESATTVYALTADGTNYETVTPGTFHRFSNTGTALGLKVTITENNSIDVSSGTNNSTQPQFLGKYGIRWSDNG